MKTFKQFISENVTVGLPKICDISTQSVIDNLKSDKFGDFQEHIDSGGADLDISKSLCLGDKVIGGYLLSINSMPETIDVIVGNIESGSYTNLVFFVDEDFINKYENKIGVFSDYIYIESQYRNKKYPDMLIDYSKSLGDYTWGLSMEDTIDYWTTTKGRIKVLEFVEDGEKVILTVTSLGNTV